MEWITDRLPDIERCIGAIRYGDGSVEVCEICYDKSKIEDARIITGNFGWVGSSDYFSEDQLVGWMPFPDPPNQEK